MKPVTLNNIDQNLGLMSLDSIIFWHSPLKNDPLEHPAHPARAKVADVFHIPNIVYMTDGKLIPKIVYKLECAEALGLNYTLI